MFTVPLSGCHDPPRSVSQCITAPSLSGLTAWISIGNCLVGFTDDSVISIVRCNSLWYGVPSILKVVVNAYSLVRKESLGIAGGLHEEKVKCRKLSTLFD